MFSYSIMQWLFFFYLYCLLGWFFESTYVSIKSKKWVNRGFMRGPFLPLYGSGAIMMLIVSRPFQHNIVLVYFAGCIGATALEYVTGVCMEAMFKVRYWDYSKQPFNFQGQICLGSTIAWGFFTILMTRFIHTPIERLVLTIPTTILTLITMFITIYIVSDLALSFKAALDLRDILVKMEKAKEEMLHIHRRLDVIIAIASEEIETKKEEFSEGMDELKESIETKLTGLKEQYRAKPTDYLDSVKEEVGELLIKYRINKEKREGLTGIKDFYKKNLIRSNPTMTSKHFKEALEELKEKYNKK